MTERNDVGQTDDDFATAAVVSAETILSKLQPIGKNTAAQLFARDPRAPKPMRISKRPRLFPGDQARAYVALVAKEGFPHER